MLVEKAQPFPIECVVRGYLVGSGWKEYRAQGSVAASSFPPDCTKLRAWKRPSSRPPPRRRWATMRTSRGKTPWRASAMTPRKQLRDLSLELYSKGREYGEGRGIIIADTKFEWGLKDGQIILIDEVLTPDSSRFWPQSEYAAGKSPALV